MTNRILVVDDDPDMLSIIKSNLVEAGFDVDTAQSGAAGLGLAMVNTYSLLILDLKMPQVDGLQICQAIRKSDPKIGILMLSGHATEDSKVRAFNLEVDDFLAKPFALSELIARTRALLRRTSLRAEDRFDTLRESERLTIGELVIDLGKRGVEMRGQEVELTATEFDLLAFLASRPGRAFSRQDLLQYVWGYEHCGYEGTVNVHINRLRSKLERDAAVPQYILTVWGIGYRFVEHNELKVAA